MGGSIKKYLILILLTLISVATLFTNTKQVEAQGYLYCYLSTFGDCYVDSSRDPNPDCEDGFIPPCGEEPLDDCNTVCIQNHIATGGIVTGCNNVPCKEPDEPPAAPCPETYTCTDAPPADCVGESRACTDPLGNTGVCCEPPIQQSDLCHTMGGATATCLTPENQNTPGQCNYNQVPLGFECSETLYPPGTLCCNTVDIVSCPGECKETCASNEFVYDSPNECQSPTSHPPNGVNCCILRSNQPVGGAEVFCVDNDPEDRTNLPDSGKIATAIGCIPVGGENGTRDFVSFLLGWGVGIAGGIAFILIVASAIMILTSAGDPKKIQAGKELLTAAISGLMLIILGAFVLEFVGVDILNIPGFGRGSP